MTKQPYSTQIFNESGYVLWTPNVSTHEDLLRTEPPNPYAESQYQLFPLGTKMVQGERVWRYTKNGATGLNIAAPVQCAAATHADADDDIASGVAGAIGDLSVSLTGTTNLAVAANYYKEGYLLANDAGTGQGQMIKIKSHAAVTNGAETLFYLYDPLWIATTTATEWGVRKNPYDSVVVTPGTTPTAIIAGIPQIAVTAYYFFWLQTGGPAAGVAQAAITVGSLCDAGVQAGKLVTTAHDATYGLARTNQIIGVAMTPAIADTEEFMVFLTLDR